jgi:hypothetical protein
MPGVPWVQRSSRCRALRWLLAPAIVAFVSFVPGLSSAQFIGTTTGKQSAFSRHASSFNISATPGGTLVGSVTLEKGKKRRHLVVDVTVNYVNAFELTHPLLTVDVNGINIPPLNYVFSCQAALACLNAMTWWVDLDQLELSNPGQIIGEPLDIAVRMSAETPFPTTLSNVTVQTGARLQPH